MPKITKQFVDSCDVGAFGEEKTYWDNDMPGFGVRVRKSGRKSFVVMYRNSQGRLRKVTLGTYGALTPQEAKTKAKQVIGKAASGRDPAEEKQKTRTAHSIAELCDDHLEAQRGRIKPSTWQMDRSRIEHHIKPLIGSRSIKDVSSSDVEKLLRDISVGKSAGTRKEIGRGGRTRGGEGVSRRTVSMLGTIMERAVRDGLIDRNPVRGVALPKDTPRKPPYFRELVQRLGRELQRGLQADVNEAALVSIQLLLLSGCRRQEILALRWSEVDFSKQCFRFSDTKSGPQIRPIGKSALNVILDRNQENDFVFPANSKSGHFVGLPRIWNAVATRAELHGMTIHGLRHWYASAAAELNFSELTIAGLLGHSFGGITARYAVTPDTALVSAADQVSQYLSDLLNS